MSTKYPRTPHVPWSNISDPDDICTLTFNHLEGKSVIITEKLDGENTFMSKDVCHARSEDSKSTPWRSYILGLHAGIKHRIGNLQLYGENMFAVHSIEYNRLTSYFYVFMVVEDGIVLPYYESKDIVQNLGLQWVPELLFIPKCSGKQLSGYKFTHSLLGNEIEGYVIRNIDSFPLSEFKDNVSKYVRPNHVQTDKHWTKSWTQAKLY